MIIDSASLRKFSRSLHFGELPREKALEQARFCQEQIGYYLANTFKDDPAYQVLGEQRNETDRTITLRKGGAVLTVETSFGINTTYDTHPPRKFHTFTAAVSHHNETLDNTGRVCDTVEWSFRIIGGLVIGVICSVLLIFGIGVASGHLIFLTFSFGAAVGGVVGQLIGNRIHRNVEDRLESKGELTDIENEWRMLTETVTLILDEASPAATEQAG